MSFRDGIRRDLQAKRQKERSAADEAKFLRIAGLVPLTRTGRMSHTKFLQITREILDGDAERIVRVGEDAERIVRVGEDAERIVRVGEEYRPDMNTGETR